MDTAFIIFVIVPILFAAAAAVRHLTRVVLGEGFSSRRGRSALDRTYADQLVAGRRDFPLLPDETVSGVSENRRHGFA